MSDQKPLKRDPALRPLSKDHHHGLLLCWKIRTGLSLNVDPARVGHYTEWFFDNHLKPHFALEEQFVFPVLGAGNPLVERALSEHREIEGLVSETANDQNLQALADKLEVHIRFEERVLFEQVQSVATNEQLALIQTIHTEQPFVEHEDQFWKK